MTISIFTITGRCQEHEYTCANGQCIDRGRRCDEWADCQDASDEAGCVWQPPFNTDHSSVGASHSTKMNSMANRETVRLRVYPARQVIRIGHTAVFRCRDEGPKRLPIQWALAKDNFQWANVTEIRLLNKSNRIEMNRGRITIHSVLPSDGGLYVCKAADAMATAYLSIEPGKFFFLFFFQWQNFLFTFQQ